tara:strand:- start:2380 stop:2613 length:234 start_codon:yes stop_codon:yes gene_type:complete
VERRKRITSLLVLTIAGALLLVPPLVYVFNQPIAHGGIPQIVIYLFTVWLLLILGTAVLNRSLPPDSADPQSGAEGD